MRKVIASEMMTLDGCIAGPEKKAGQGLDWFRWNDEMERRAVELMDSLDTIIFGRKTYEMMAEYWPDAAPPEENPAIISFMNSASKIVFSKTLETADWNNTRIEREIDAAAIRRMKEQPGGDMVIYGSGEIVAEFINGGLLDQYLLFVHPVVLGGGNPLFSGVRTKQNLKLMETHTFDTGVVLLKYESVLQG